MVRWGRKERWGHDPLGRSPVAVAGDPLGRTVAGRIEVRNRSGDLEAVGFRSKRLDPGGYWHRIDRIGHLAVRAGILLVEEGRMSSLSEVGHSLEVRRRTEVVEVDIPGGRNPAGVPVAGNPGRNWGGIGCMGLTC